MEVKKMYICSCGSDTFKVEGMGGRGNEGLNFYCIKCEKHYVGDKYSNEIRKYEW